MTNTIKQKKIKLTVLFVVIFITAIAFVVETYAWFVGNTRVSASQFDVSVTTNDGLELSLDGHTWSSTSISLGESEITTAIASTYSNNTNKWPTTGLSPVSTGGYIDSSRSKLKLFEKTSLSSRAGGYNLTTSEINNATLEGDGYVAFDLFVRNGTGSLYDSAYDPNGEEDIYLTSSSNAYSPVNGTVTYGAANSLRVGFFEIGRIKAKGYNENTLRNITCAGGSGITSLCNSTDLANRRSNTWNIWEPNHDIHTVNLVNYFNSVCKKRTSGGGYTTNPCDPITINQEVNTYAVTQALNSSDDVDIYDGLNNYTPYGLSQMTTYKSQSSTINNNDKESLLKLAGNSITKVRVYIWLEGQDIDNYDLIAKDPAISLSFGLTKDRYGLQEETSEGTTDFEKDS